MAIITPQPEEDELSTELLTDPLLFKELCWPDISFYDDQIRIIESVRDNVETYVPAGNMLGKDFISGFIALWFFCSRSPARVVTSSVDYSQLKSVLWGEIRRFVDSSVFDLGLLINDLLIRQIRPDGTIEPRSEMVGRVAQKGEGMLGRHLEKGENEEPRTLAIIDEGSGFEDIHYNSISTWAHRILIIGNSYPCENFWKKGVKAGDLEDESRPGRYFRKVIKITAERSPNIRLALEEKKLGLEPSRRVVVPGVMSWSDYCYRRSTWDAMKQCIGLDAEFYEGEEIKLFPPVLLSRCNQLAYTLGLAGRRARAMGIDTAEGGDSTSWTLVDELGIIAKITMKTPDTSVIPGRTIGLMKEFGVRPEDTLFDSGGGGKEHADLLRSQGYPVRSVSFGASPTSADQFALHKKMPDERREAQEDREVYKNRRAEMYGEASKVLRGAHPSGIGAAGFAIPAEYEELARQLAIIPKCYDAEGRLFLPPKNKPSPNYTGKTLSGLLGCSPDEADSFVLAIFAMIWTETESVVGVMF
jgi:hypothetical protein